MASVFSLTVMSLSRFCIVSGHETTLSFFRTQRGPSSNINQDRYKAMAVVVIIWLLSLVIAVPPIFGWGQFVADPSGIR